MPPVADGSLRECGAFRRRVNERARCSTNRLRKAFCACRSQSQSTAGDRSCTCPSLRLSSGRIGQSCQSPARGAQAESPGGRGARGGDVQQRNAQRTTTATTHARPWKQPVLQLLLRESRSELKPTQREGSGCLLRVARHIAAAPHLPFQVFAEQLVRRRNVLFAHRANAIQL